MEGKEEESKQEETQQTSTNHDNKDVPALATEHKQQDENEAPKTASSRKDTERKRASARSSSRSKGQRQGSAGGKKKGGKKKGGAGNAPQDVRDMDFSIEGADKKPPPGTAPIMLSLREMVDWGLLESTDQKLEEVPYFSSIPLDQVEANIEKAGKLSPFHRLKQVIPKYKEETEKKQQEGKEEEVKGEEEDENYTEKLLLIKDTDQVYGENFLVCLAPTVAKEQVDAVKAKERAEREAREAEERRQREEEERRRREEEGINNRVVEDTPLTPNESYSSKTITETESEVQRLSPKSMRPKIKISLRRALKDFGVKYGFNDRDAEQGIVEFKQRKDPNFNVKKHEQDIGLQACIGSLTGFSDKASQTTWDRKVNASVQTSTKAIGDDVTTEKKEAQKKAEESRKIRDFLDVVLPQVEYALSQNETLNIYEDELNQLEDDDAALISTQGENSLREVRTFMDLQLSNGKALRAIDWHPRIPKWVATAAAPQMKFEEWLKGSGKVTFSHVIVFTLTEFSSQIVLQSPSPITCFRWNPTTPTLIAAGAECGQVMMFDISPATDKLAKKQKRPSSTGESETKSSSEGSSSNSNRAVVVKPTAMSALDSSHRGNVVDLMWLPPHATMHPRSKVFQQADHHKCVQFVSAGADGRLAVWDSRFREQSRQTARRRSADLIPTQGSVVAVAGEMQIIPPPETPWHPIYDCACHRGTEKPLFTCVSWNITQPAEPMLALTEEGQFVCVDWAPKGQGVNVANYLQSESFTSSGKEEKKEAEEEESEAVEMGNGSILWTCTDHFRPGTCIHRSPFMEDVILSVGVFAFSLWQKGIQRPIFQSPMAASSLTCGSWSPTRSAVLFLGRADGVVDVWDFTDTTLKPSMSIPVISSSISSIQFRTIGTRAAPHGASDNNASTTAPDQQLLGIGDAKGSLHVVEIPTSLMRSSSNERKQFKDTFTREVRRVKWYAQRFEIRKKEAEEQERKRQADELKRESEKSARENALNQLRSQLPNGDDWTVEDLEQEEERRKLQKEEEQYQKFEDKIEKEIQELKEKLESGENIEEEDSKSTS
eukprot:gb/GECG01014615.1/.p1 GENE.gb/GECG01014615.1/~~gb/GECG01014615.1/.p1  ORF type:complete len:1058 (+),score=218.00 gb/GECG01014615.1/:1-3174(+)